MISMGQVRRSLGCMGCAGDCSNYGMNGLGADGDGGWDIYAGSTYEGTQYGTLPPIAPSQGVNWAGVIAPIVQGATSVLVPRYAVPQLNPGESLTRTAQGSQLTQQAAGYPLQAGTLGLNPSLGGGGVSMGLLAILAVGAVLMLGKRGGN